MAHYWSEEPSKFHEISSPLKVVEYESGKYVAVGDGDLVVRELQWSDMGMHKCVARNEFGEDMKEAFVYPLAPSPGKVTRGVPNTRLP